jgi:hypothetical protein
LNKFISEFGGNTEPVIFGFVDNGLEAKEQDAVLAGARFGGKIAEKLIAIPNRVSKWNRSSGSRLGAERLKYLPVTPQRVRN